MTGGVQAFGVGRLSLPRGLRPGSVWWVVAITAIAVNLALTAYVGWTATAPAFPFDEVHLLEVSRIVAGLEVPRVRGAGYYPGWAIVFAPVWWFTNDPEVVYRAASVLGWIIAAATIYPLALVARRFRLTMPQALTAAAIVSSLPARSVQADYVLSERLVFLLVVVAALAAFRLWERVTYSRVIIFAVVAAAVYLAHMRMLPFVLASGIWLAALALKRWRVALVGLVTLGVGVLGVNRLGSLLNHIALGTAASQSDSVVEKILHLRPGLFLRVALGQTWNQIVGSYGLFAIGIVAVIFLTWREVRRLRLGRASWLFGVFTASWLLSVLAWASDWSLYNNPWRRLDAWIYGRYIDPVAALVVLVGLALVIRGIRTRVWAVGLGVALAVIVPTVFWVAREAPTWGYITPAHSAGILPWGWLLPKETFPPGMTPTLTNANSFWLIASLSVLACLIAYRVLRRWGVVLAVGILVLAVLGSFGANASSDKFRAAQFLSEKSTGPVQELIDEHGPVTFAWDTACDRRGFTSGVGQNMMGWAFVDDAILGSIRSDEVPDPDYDVVFSCVDSSLLAESGALPIRDTDIYQSWLWVMPGDLQDALQAEGKLMTEQELEAVQP